MSRKSLLLAFIGVACSLSAFSQYKSNSAGDVGGGGWLNKCIFKTSESTTITYDVPGTMSINLIPNSGVVNIIIKNNMGVVVKQSKIDTSITTNTEIQTSNFPVGTYIIAVKDEQGRTLKNEQLLID